MIKVILSSLSIVIMVNISESRDVRQRTAGPYGGSFSAIAVDGHGNVFSGLRNLYISRDNGET